MKSEFLTWAIVIGFLLVNCNSAPKATDQDIKAYNIDFNWG